MKVLKETIKFRYALSKDEEIEKWMSENSLIPSIAFIGRSNVGKSSLINALFKKGTAKTSKTPGRTQKINIFSFDVESEQTKNEEPSGEDNKEKIRRTYYFHDLPGYGHAQVSREMKKNWDRMMGLYFSLLEPNTLLLTLQDARHPMMSADVQFQEFIKQRPELSSYLILNKIDKLKKQKEKSALKKVTKEIIKEFTYVKEIHLVSAETKQGIDALEYSILSHLENLSLRDPS